MAERQQLPPEAYARVFENIPEGQQILEELVARFGRNPYKPGGLDAQRATDFNAGGLEVVQFILRRINRAHGVDDGNDTEPAG
ncbi:hypothetical protein [Arenimonas sp.]|uniref:Bbp19 family protein n=1 Tax=Arenimonas sp. TaxID=1872635 RepID=UPI0039E482D4